MGGMEINSVPAALREQMWLCNLVHFVPAWLRERIWGAGIFFSVKGILFPQRCGNRCGCVFFFSVEGILFPHRCGNGIFLAGNTIFQ
jgi:hypothetical protein